MEKESTHSNPNLKDTRTEGSLRSLLQGHDKQGFIVPDNYFEKLQLDIEQRLKDDKNTLSTVQKSTYKVWIWSVAAAVVALLLTFFIFLTNEGKKHGDASQFSQIVQQSSSQIHNPQSKDTVKNKQQGQGIVNTNKLIPVTKVDSSSVLGKNTVIEDISDDEIIEYLLEEDFDVSDLNN